MKKNNGQALVMFISILPILLMFGALIVDAGIVLSEKNSIINIIKNKETIEEIKKTIVNNNIEIKSINENEKCVIIKSSVESIFGKVIGKNEYEIIVEKCMNEEG